MTEAKPATTSAQLIRELVRISNERPIKEFALKMLERDSEKLRKAAPDQHAMLLGSIAALRGDAQKTVQHYDMALRLSSNESSMLVNYAISMELLTDFARARELMRAAVDKAPGNVDVLRSAYNLLVDIGAIQTAASLEEISARYNVQFDVGDECWARHGARLLNVHKVTEDDLMRLIALAKTAARARGILRPLSRYNVTYAIAGAPSLVYEMVLDEPVDVCSEIETAVFDVLTSEPIPAEASGVLIFTVGFPFRGEAEVRGAA